MPVTVGGSPITPTQAEQLRVALGVDGDPVTARLTSLNNTDDAIFLRASVPHLVAASVIADYVGAAPAATAPAAFTAVQWDAAATATAGEMQYQITALPSNGGSAITALEYRVGTGAAIALTGTGTGNRTVTAGWSAGTAADTQIRAVNAIGAGAWSDIKNRTPASAASGPAYIEETVTTGFGTLAGTLPAGVTASDYLTAIVWSTIDGAAATMSEPSGWTPGDGVQNPNELRGARVFTAPGNVGTLTFTGTNIQGLQIIGTTAPLRAGYVLAAADYGGGTSGAGSGANQPTRPVTANLGDLVVSSYIQYDAGGTGPLVEPGTPQAGYTRERFDNAAAPYLSILSAENVAAGTTGTINHDANGGFSGRFLFTGAYGT